MQVIEPLDRGSEGCGDMLIEIVERQALVEPETQTIQLNWRQRRGFVTGQHRIACGIAFQHFEPVGRNQQRGAGLVQPVIGTADALDQPCGALGAPMQITLSTAPQSIPRSRVEVQTTAFSLPATMAPSTFLRWSTSSEP